MKKILPAAALLLVLGSCQAGGSSSVSSSSPSSDFPASESSSGPTLSSSSSLSLYALLEGLQGELALKGNFLRDYENPSLQDLSTELSVYFGDGVWESKEEGFSTMTAYRSASGMAVKRSLDYQNKVTETPLSENGLTAIPFSRFENPFLRVEDSDFVKTDDGYSFELGQEEGAAFAYALSGYGDLSIASGAIETSADGTIESLSFTGRALSDPSGNALTPILTFEVTTAEEVGFLYCDSLPSLPGQEAVAGLLSSLRKGNYTLSLQTFPEGDDQGVERYMEVSDSLIYVEDRQGGIPFASYGYLGAEGGVIPYEVTGGIMKAIGPAEEGSIASALPPFDLDPAFFLPEGSGYVLSPWAYDYVSRIDPGYLIDSYLEVMVEGSFRLFIDEGSAVFSYEYEATDFYTGRLLKGMLEMKVVDIGITKPRYTADNLVPYEPPKSYEELDSAMAEVLGGYFGNDLSLLPYPSFDGLEGVEGSEGFGYFALYFHVGKDADLNAAYLSYDALLADIGWSKEDNPSGGYDYRIERGGGSGYFHLTLEETPTVNFINLYIYRMDFDSPMDAFFEPLAFSPNSTLDISIGDSYLSRDDGSLLKKTSKRLVYEWSDEAEHLTAYDEGTLSLERYLVPSGGSLDVYEKATGGWAKTGTLEGTLLYATATIWNFAYDYGSSFLPDGQGGYTLAYGEASDALIGLLYGNAFDWEDLASPIEATLTENGGEAVITIDLSSPMLYGDEGLAADHNVHIEARLSKVGTTSVEAPF